MRGRTGGTEPRPKPRAAAGDRGQGCSRSRWRRGRASTDSSSSGETRHHSSYTVPGRDSWQQVGPGTRAVTPRVRSWLEAIRTPREMERLVSPLLALQFYP